MKYLCDQFCMKQRGRKFARCQRHSIHHPHSAQKLPQKVLFLVKNDLKYLDTVGLNHEIGFRNELSKMIINQYFLHFFSILISLCITE